ncbi:multiple C2 and transmembrane domain-containing protein-like [Zerene cesonia]|uniref:multiple C2 and transmembrane domain-containing protein-like n=1 Tax=Zerene cesonia TaxID=33412 RepID=UPI0018E58F89|nr:multiple C2 and transmembrane domain-containing protein-like [Zerene cesonia]
MSFRTKVQVEVSPVQIEPIGDVYKQNVEVDTHPPEPVPLLKSTETSSGTDDTDVPDRPISFEILTQNNKRCDGFSVDAELTTDSENVIINQTELTNLESLEFFLFSKLAFKPYKDDDMTWYRVTDSWNDVGQLSITLYGAKGLSALTLSGSVNAYCILELDNARVQTHTIKGTSEPSWDKNFVFSINDITSTVDIAVYEESLIQSMKGEMLGKISIPLLRIQNNEKRWYALKNRSKKASARGNCPRILLEMSVVWNPVKASMRLFRPKETKYIQKSPKFDIPLIYSNLIFIKHIFKVFRSGNEHFKRVFEWENQELSAMALGGWLIFWYFFRLWMTPLLLLLPFIHYWLVQRNNTVIVPLYQSEDDESDEEVETQKDEKTIKTRISELQDLTITIKTGIDYIVSLLERLHNLVNFSVPYLSYLFMLALVGLSIAFYLIPANYMFMAFGLYKFGRKFLNPGRVPNNDILDFISRVPDNQMLKQWRELKVPEPNLSRSDSGKRR